MISGGRFTNLAGASSLLAAILVLGCEAEPNARAVLERAEKALGMSAPLERISVIETFADCEGPGGSFQTRVVSARDGRMRFEQVSSTGRFLAGIVEGGAFRYDPETKEYDEADIATRTFLKGHELHMLALAPETRLRDPELGGKREFSGESVWVVRFLDDADAEVEMYYSVESGRPVGMKNVNHTGRGERDVFVRFDDWQEVDGLSLFRKAVFTQGKDDYAYDYVDIDLHASEDRLSLEDAGS